MDVVSQSTEMVENGQAAEDLDQNPNLLNVDNGTGDLTTGELLTHA